MYTEMTVQYDKKDYFVAKTTFSEKLMPAFRAVDPVSAITHFAAFLACLPGMAMLLVRAAAMGADSVTLISFSVYMLTMIMLYGTSAAYHTFNTNAEVRTHMKKLDHAMIYLMIAGSYTPVCTIVLQGKTGLILLVGIWMIAAAGVCMTLLWIDCPKWVSSSVYIAMGWTAVLVIGKLYHIMPGAGFFWLVLGGVMYTVGGVIYALKFSLPGRFSGVLGPHEIFHLFVMAGSVCHYLMMIKYVC